jgi:hypothetical protein
MKEIAVTSLLGYWLPCPAFAMIFSQLRFIGGLTSFTQIYDHELKM